MSKKKEVIDPENITDEMIISKLERISATGHSYRDIFGDWLDLTEACLTALPSHAKSVAQDGKMAEDTEETKALFAKLSLKYGRDSRERAVEYMTLFAQAMSLLITKSDAHSREGQYQDTVGSVYMKMEMGNAHTGQYFTPWPVALLMAQLTSGHGETEREVHTRLKAALSHPDNVMGMAVLLASTLISDSLEAQEYFHSHVIPAAFPFYDPIKVCDPCVGSGVMLLASASCMPKWIVQYGLVQFYGMDIDYQCVQMARINCMLYGLNGTYLKAAAELSGIEIQALPEPYQTAYAQVQAEPERSLEISQELFEYKQMSMTF